MTRKCKVGIDYFSHDVDMLQDKKIKLIKAKHGLIGYAVYLRLLEEIYKGNGYYIIVDDDFNILFSDDNNINYNDYILILNDCILKDLFNDNYYKKYKILTSKRIQENYCLATERRKEVEFIREYLLVDIHKLYDEKVNIIILDLNVDINPLNVGISTQSKVNKSKVKENKAITNNILSDFFDSIWLLYPKKEGKASVGEKQKEILFKIGYDEIKRCVERYVKTKIGTDSKYLKMGSTFFNSGYIDYLDKNQTIVETKVQTKTEEIPEYKPMYGIDLIAEMEKENAK